MKKNRKGFTLIELIVVIAIVAALGLAATFGLKNVMDKNKANIHKNDLRDILTSSKTYIAVKKMSDSSERRSFTVGDVVKSGYLDDKIYKKLNVLTCSNFTKDTTVYYKTENGIRIVELTDTDGNYCNLDNIDNCPAANEVCK